MGPADRFRARLRQSEVQDLALRDEFLDRAGHVLDGDGRVDAVLIVQIDTVRPEPLERTLYYFPDAFGPAIEATGFEVEPELGGDDNVVADRGKRFAHEVFARVRTVDLRRIEKRDAFFVSPADDTDALGAVRRGTIVGADAHASKAERRDFQLTQLALSHHFLSWMRGRVTTRAACAGRFRRRARCGHGHSRDHQRDIGEEVAATEGTTSRSSGCNDEFALAHRVSPRWLKQGLEAVAWSTVDDGHVSFVVALAGGGHEAVQSLDLP